MNKTKRVAWHKRLKKAKKRAEKARTARASAATTHSRQATPRR